MGLDARTPTTRNEDLTGAEESDLLNSGRPTKTDLVLCLLRRNH